MTVYALAQKDAFERIKVTKHENKASAKFWLNELSQEWGGFVFETSEDIGCLLTTLQVIYKKITGNSVSFSSRTEGQQRVFEAVVDAHAGEDTLPQLQPQESEMAEAAEKKTKKEPKAKEIEAKKYPAGKVADFKQVRAGTVRAKLLKLMDGKRTTDQIAAELGTTRSNLRVTLNCLSRDCAIGHEIDDKDRLTVLLPGSKTVADAITDQAPEKKGAKPKAAAVAAA